jgi:hypothetical protein
MTIGANTSNEEVDAASLLDHLLVMGALGNEVGGITIEDMDILLRTIDVVEEVAGHESMIALGMSLGQANILVHVKSQNVFEGYASFATGCYKSIVHAYG